MQRVTVTLDEELLSEVDALMALRGYQNRSEAIRDLIDLLQGPRDPDRPLAGGCLKGHRHIQKLLPDRRAIAHRATISVALSSDDLGSVMMRL